MVLYLFPLFGVFFVVLPNVVLQADAPQGKGTRVTGRHVYFEGEILIIQSFVGSADFIGNPRKRVTIVEEIGTVSFLSERTFRGGIYSPYPGLEETGARTTISCKCWVFSVNATSQYPSFAELRRMSVTVTGS